MFHVLTCPVCILRSSIPNSNKDLFMIYLVLFFHHRFYFTFKALLFQFQRGSSIFSFHRIQKSVVNNDAAFSFLLQNLFLFLLLSPDLTRSNLHSDHLLVGRRWRRHWQGRAAGLPRAEGEGKKWREWELDADISGANSRPETLLLPLSQLAKLTLIEIGRA